MLYRCFIETPDLANLLGIYPKMDSTHGYGFYSKIFIIQILMKCIEIFKKTQLIVMVLSACGLSILLLGILSIKYTTISYHGIGIKQDLSRMEKNKGLE